MPPASKAEDLLRLYEKIALIRSVETGLLAQFAEGKISGTIHTCVGQELTGIAVAEALEDGDLIFSNHRCHGHYIARTGDVDGLVAEVLGRESGACAGRGGSQHLHKDGFFSNGVQGGIMPAAAGFALALKIRDAGKICAVFIGDGTLGEGAVYETLNIAAKWELPLLIVLENNLYAQSTPQAQTLAGDIDARFEAFGIPAAAASAWDPGALVSAARAQAAAVRRTGAPRLLRVDTYRLNAHSKGDDDRDPGEVRAYREKDALARFAADDPDGARRVQADADQLAAAAISRATASPASVAAQAESAARAPLRWTRTPLGGDRQAVVLIQEALRRNMEKDLSVLILGEDVADPYGGAFKATKGLSTRFPGRVFNTPISEAAVVGIGGGLALQGFKPVVEIMFGDFLTLAADQLINHAAKFRWMYDDRVRVPLVVRTPMGGRRGYGPTHSQSLEKHFLGLPGTTMLALHSRCDAGEVYDAVFAGVDRPTIVIENKLLYGSRLSAPVPAGFFWERTDEPFPTSRLTSAGAPDATILCYGGMLPHAEAAAETLFDEDELVCEIVCPLQLYPFDHRPLLESVRRSGRLLVVEEGLSFAGFGAEALASLLAEDSRCLPGGVRRLGASEHPIPAAPALEKAALPDADKIAAAVRELADGR
jgi:2-oxoisovalerate dehydrogenase E1 component